MGSLSLPHLLIVLAIVVVLFGTRKLRGIGSDLGETVRAFRQATGEPDAENARAIPPEAAQQPAAGAQPPQHE
jgi:sec-independent protein translocase protein TatA